MNLFIPSDLRPRMSSQGRYLLAALGLVVSCLGHSIAEESTAASNPAVLGRIGENEIGVEVVRLFLAGLNDTQAEAVNRNPALLNQLVRSFLVQKIVLKEALAKKWDQEPSVAAQLARVRESTLTDSY